RGNSRLSRACNGLFVLLAKALGVFHDSPLSSFDFRTKLPPQTVLAKQITRRQKTTSDAVLDLALHLSGGRRKRRRQLIPQFLPAGPEVVDKQRRAFNAGQRPRYDPI